MTDEHEALKRIKAELDRVGPNSSVFVTDNIGDLRLVVGMADRVRALWPPDDDDAAHLEDVKITLAEPLASLQRTLEDRLWASNFTPSWVSAYVEEFTDEQRPLVDEVKHLTGTVPAVYSDGTAHDQRGRFLVIYRIMHRGEERIVSQENAELVVALRDVLRRVRHDHGT